MRNSEIAAVLYDIADMLEMQNVQFKPAAYRKAARSVEESPKEAAEMYAKSGKEGFMQLPGVGASIAEKIEEMLTTGKLNYYSELKKKFPKHIAELMEIPGMGPKRIQILNEKLNITTAAQLQKAAQQHKISKLPGFGEKSEQDILKGIETFRKGQERMLLGYALPTALEIESRLKALKFVSRASIAGSLRRKKETIGDIDILASSSNPKKVMEYFTTIEGTDRVLAKGSTKSSILLKSGIQVDLRVVGEESYGAALQYFTGSKEHNVAIRALAMAKGLKINEYGVFRADNQVAGKTEEEVYKAIGMDCPEPEIRESRGEVEAALKHRLPKLLPYGSIKGDFHTHTKLTDGSNTIQEMIEAAKRIGYEYLAITDHSKSERIANGLSEEKMHEHIKNIREIARKTKGITVLAGTEVDILANGELDYSDELLKKFDITVASIHSRFKSTKEEMTSRIITALENPCTDILGHPTGRRIGKREPIEADWGRVFEKAAEKKVWLEINAHPERTDLNDINAMQAKRHGCKFTINTDAHSTTGMEYMNLGVAIARRAWLTSTDVVNTAAAKELHKFFKRIK